MNGQGLLPLFMVQILSNFLQSFVKLLSETCFEIKTGYPICLTEREEELVQLEQVPPLKTKLGNNKIDKYT